MKPLWKVVHIVRYTWVLVAKDKPNHLTTDSLRIVPGKQNIGGKR